MKIKDYKCNGCGKRDFFAEFEEAEELDDDKPLSKEDQEAFENALIAFEKVISEG